MLYNLITFNSWAQFFAFWVYFTLFDLSIFMLIANFYINGYLEYKERRCKRRGNRRTKKSRCKIR